VEIADVRYARTPDGAYIAYAVTGQGPIDLVHQLDFSTYIDAEFEDPLVRGWYERLTSFSRVILHDRRGTGLSSRHVPPPNLETRVSDLEVVLDAVGSERPVLLGAFEACAPNVLLAATRPERAHSLVWINPVARSVWTPDYPWGVRPEMVEEEMHIMELWGTLDYGRAFLEFQASRGNVYPDEEVAHVAKAARNVCTPDVAAELNRMWYETDIRPVLPAVQAPALLIVHEGLEDHVAQAHHIASLMPNATVKGMPGRAWDVQGLVQWAEEIRRFVGVEPSPANLDTVLSTVLFTDIVGSAQKQTSLGDHGWKQLVEQHHAIVRDALARYRGIENDTAGDGFYATFDGPARAVRCALNVVHRVRDLGIEIRAGVHTGECEVIDGKHAGLAVTIGARIASDAGSSEVLVSRTVKDLTAGSGFTFEDAGEHELKGVPDRWHLYRVLN
jgi:class 3 adenylate cyclase/pimeloyl-ACP methyl ester carboxylesterase